MSRFPRNTNPVRSTLYALGEQRLNRIVTPGAANEIKDYRVRRAGLAEAGRNLGRKALVATVAAGAAVGVGIGVEGVAKAFTTTPEIHQPANTQPTDALAHTENSANTANLQAQPEQPHPTEQP